MKFTKSLIATGVMAAAATASAKTTMNVSGEAFFQQNTYENEPDAALANFADDQTTAKGMKVDGVYVGFETEWTGFNTNVDLYRHENGFMELYYLNVTTSHMGGKLDVTIGLQDDLTGGIVNYGRLDAGEDRYVTSGVSASYKLANGTASFFAGSTPEELYFVSVDLDSDGENDYEETADTSKFLGGTYMGFAYNASYNALDVAVSYHMRNTGEVEFAAVPVTLEDAAQNIMTVGLGYNMGATTLGLDYTQRTDGTFVDGGDDTVYTTIQFQASHKAGMWVPTLSYATVNTTVGDAEHDVQSMNLDVAYTAGKGHDWFFAYNTSTSETKDSDPSDAATDTELYLGARFEGSFGI